MRKIKHNANNEVAQNLQIVIFIDGYMHVPQIIENRKWLPYSCAYLITKGYANVSEVTWFWDQHFEVKKIKVGIERQGMCFILHFLSIYFTSPCAHTQSLFLFRSHIKSTCLVVCFIQIGKLYARHSPHKMRIVMPTSNLNLLNRFETSPGNPEWEPEW